MTETEPIPPEGTMDYVDYLLDGLEAEIRLSERYGLDLNSVDFYKGMLRAAYQQAMERITTIQQELGKERDALSSSDHYSSGDKRNRP